MSFACYDPSIGLIRQAEILMNSEQKALSEALHTLGKAVFAAAPNDGTLLQSVGWNAPPLNRVDLQSMADNVAYVLEKVDPKVFEEIEIPFSRHISNIASFQSHTLPNLWNGNGGNAYQVYNALLTSIYFDYADLVKSRIDLEKIEDDLIPKKLASRLRFVKTTLAKLETGSVALGDQVSAINAAHEAALSFPTDLESMQEVRDQVDQIAQSAARDLAQIGLMTAEVTNLLQSVQASRDEAIKLVENTEDAYSAATTKGLGEAFQTRADRLTKSMWTWVGGLMVALGVGAYLGSSRVNTLQELIVKNANSELIWLNLLIAFFSIAAPVWFAWIATKQIGHRFRLSEDYAFKASVAKAYEGYRREAARLDPAFANRLFASALDRIGEPPIRFVENETPGSPFHDLLSGRLRRSGPAEQTPTES